MAGFILTLFVIGVSVNASPAWAITTTPSSPRPNTTFTISGDVGGVGSSLTVWKGSQCNAGPALIVFGPTAVGPGAYSVDVVGGLPAGQYCARTFVEGWYVFTVADPATVMQTRPLAVGGEMIPVDQVQLVFPWLALITALVMLSVHTLVKRGRARDS